MRGSVLVALGLVLVLAIAGCGSSDIDDSGSGTTTTSSSGEPSGETGPNTPAPNPLAESESVTIAYAAPIEAFATLLLADYFGEFEKENLDVTIQQVSPADGALLLAQGEVDVQFSGFSANFFNQVASGTDVRYVANNQVKDVPQNGFYIQKDLLDENGDPDIERIPGSRVIAGIGGGGFGNAGALPLYQWLKSNDIGPNDVETLTIPAPPDVLGALENGEADIGLLLTPVWQQITEDSCCVLIEETGGVGAGIIAATGTLIDDRPEVAEAVFRAMMRTNRTYLQGDYNEDPEVLEALSEITGQELSPNAPTITFDPDLGFDASLIPAYQEMFREAGVLSYEDELTGSDLVDTSPVDANL